jgi:hypothetical protein
MTQLPYPSWSSPTGNANARRRLPRVSRHPEPALGAHLMTATPTPVVFIPALLSDEAMYREVI